LLRASRPGGLEGVRLEWSSEWAVTVVLASAGYPEGSSKGDLIAGLEQVSERFAGAHAQGVGVDCVDCVDCVDGVDGVDGAAGEAIVEVTHAGTARTDTGVVTAGGRVLNVTALGADIDSARGAAYAAAEMISFNGMQIRRDIAARAADTPTQALAREGVK